MWRDKGVPLRELREEWTYEDLLHANALLDMEADMDAAVEGWTDAKARRGGKAG